MSSASDLLNQQFVQSGWRLRSPIQSDIGSSERRVGSTVKVPIWIFAADGQRISCDRPVEVELTSGDDGCYASCDRLHVHSFGESQRECLSDLHRQVIFFYNDYSTVAEDDVVGMAVQLRALYRNHFSRQV